MKTVRGILKAFNASRPIRFLNDTTTTSEHSKLLRYSDASEVRDLANRRNFAADNSIALPPIIRFTVESAREKGYGT